MYPDQSFACGNIQDTPQTTYGTLMTLKSRKCFEMCEALASSTSPAGIWNQRVWGALCLPVDSEKAGPYFAGHVILISVLSNESSVVHRTFANANHTVAHFLIFWSRYWSDHNPRHKSSLDHTFQHTPARVCLVLKIVKASIFTRLSHGSWYCIVIINASTDSIAWVRFNVFSKLWI